MGRTVSSSEGCGRELPVRPVRYGRVGVAGLAAFVALASCLAVAGPSRAEQPPGPPAAYLATMPGHGHGKPLVLGYCLVGARLCVERTALAWGDVCASNAADSIGGGSSGDVVGGRPWLLGYAGWRCGPDGEWHDKSERVPGGYNWGD